MMRAGERDPGSWQLERRIPAMLLLMLAIQVGAALVWAGALDQRISRVETAVNAQAALLERTVRLEEKLRYALAALARIEGKLDSMERSKHVHLQPD